MGLCPGQGVSAFPSYCSSGGVSMGTSFLLHLGYNKKHNVTLKQAINFVHEI